MSDHEEDYSMTEDASQAINETRFHDQVAIILEFADSIKKYMTTNVIPIKNKLQKKRIKGSDR